MSNMCSFPMLKQACIQALQLDTPSENNAELFATIVDPQSVLDLIAVAEKHITNEELQSLHNVISDLTNFIRRTSNCGIEATELLLKSKKVVEVTSLKKATAGSFYGSIVPERRKTPRGPRVTQAVVESRNTEKEDAYKELNICP